MAFFDWIFFFFAPVIRVFHVFGLEIWHIKTEALKAEPLYRVFVLWLGMVDARSAMSQNFRVAWLLHFTNVKIWMKRFLCEPLPVMCKTFHKSSSFYQPCTCMSNRNNQIEFLKKQLFNHKLDKLLPKIYD